MTTTDTRRWACKRCGRLEVEVADYPRKRGYIVVTCLSLTCGAQSTPLPRQTPRRRLRYSAMSHRPRVTPPWWAD